MHSVLLSHSLIFFLTENDKKRGTKFFLHFKLAMKSLLALQSHFYTTLLTLKAMGSFPVILYFIGLTRRLGSMVHIPLLQVKVYQGLETVRLWVQIPALQTRLVVRRKYFYNDLCLYFHLFNS